MEIRRYRRETDWIEAVRRDLEAAARDASSNGRGILRLCLAGGRTPEPVYRGLAALPLLGPKLELWLGDEREVESGSPDRNGALLLRAFRGSAWDPVPEFVTWPEGPAGEACRAYETLLRGLPEPFFDLSLLGIGEDGHTAGVFPGGRIPGEASLLAVPSTAPAEPRARMTLTPRALASTRELRFLLRGPEKRLLAERLAVDTGTDSAGLLPSEIVARLARERGARVRVLYCET